LLIPCFFFEPVGKVVSSSFASVPRQPGKTRRASSNGIDQRRLAGLVKAAGLCYVSTDQLVLRRRRHGARFSYVDRAGKPCSPATVRRLKQLAVPPAYEDVFYAEDPRAHIQAFGRDAAGRLQYRYHSDWVQVRETIKARQLVQLVEALPRIRRSIARHLAVRKPSREFALAAVIDLVGRSAIRAGSNAYARARGTRGATTLRKSHVSIDGPVITLTFPSKGGSKISRKIRAARLAAAFTVLQRLPGRRLFQYRDPSGTVRRVNRRQVNEFLHEIAGVKISLKDFRTLIACGAVMQALARTPPAPSRRRRRRQVLDAVRVAAEELANTPAICRRSYVHDTVVSAFENGALQRFSDNLKRCRSPAARERLLAKIIAP
jgi:DNA topoisomerase-1